MSEEITRRQALQRGAAATAAIATAGGAGAAASSGSAQASATVDITAPGRRAGEWLAGAADGLFSSGYDPDDVHDMQGENIAWEMYNTADVFRRNDQGFLQESFNHVQPDDPLSSSLAAMTWSEVRARIHQGIQSGEDVMDYRDAARDDGLDYLSVRCQNYIRQWNEGAAEFVRMVSTFFPDDEGASLDADHVNGETSSGFGPIQLDDITAEFDGEEEVVLSPSDVLGTHQSENRYIDEIEVEVREYYLPNGDTEDVYHIYLSHGNGDMGSGSQNFSPIELSHSGDDINPEIFDYETSTSNTGDGIIMLDPQGYKDLLDAVDDVRSDLEQNVIEYADEVANSLSQGDLEGTEILGPTDWRTQYDQDDMSGYHYEMQALGLLEPDDVEQEVTIVHDGSSYTGYLYVRNDWTELADWEWSYEDGELVVDDDSIMSDSMYVIDGEEYDSDEVADGVEVDEPDTVGLETAGDLSSFIPEGQTVSGEITSAYLGYYDADDSVSQLSLSADDDWTLEEVHGDDRLTLSSYDQTVRDPAMSLEQAQHRSDQYVTVDDLEDDGIFTGGGDDDSILDSIPWWGWAAGAGAVILGALSSGSS